MTRALMGAGRLGRRYSAVLALLALWQIMFWAGRLPDYLLGPSVIVQSFLAALPTAAFQQHVTHSLWRALAGFFLGAGAGVILGVWSGVSRRAERFFDPLVSLTYPLPKTAFLPVFTVWLGMGHGSKIAVIALAAFFPAFITSMAGTRLTDQKHVWSARNMGATQGQIFRKIVLPSAAPSIFSGLRLALALAFILLFAAEMFGARTGLGFLIIMAEASLRFDLMFVAIVTIAVLGFGFDRLLLLIRHKALPWEPGEGGRL